MKVCSISGFRGFAFGLVVLGFCGRAFAASHNWRVNELFSNSDGTIQFIELKECCGTSEENGTGNKTVTSLTVFHSITLNSSPGDTANRHILLGTAAFAALPGAPPLDYVISANFIAVGGFSRGGGGDTIRYAPLQNYDSLTFGAGVLPTDGVQSLQKTNLGPPHNQSVVVVVNSPTNYAGVTGSVDAGGGCTDVDGDGYGNPGDASCPNGSAIDCNDNNDQVNPGASEALACADVLDNDCDNLTDCADPDCSGDPACVCACDADVAAPIGTLNFIDVVTIEDCRRGFGCNCTPSCDVNCDGTVDHADTGVALHQFRGGPGDGCDIPTGACCQQDDTCLHEQQFLCNNDPQFPQFAGVYQGDGTTCSPNPCLPPPPAPGGDDRCDGGPQGGQVCSNGGDCPGGSCGAKNRALSFTTPAAHVAQGVPRAVRVTVTASPQFPSIVGDEWWATLPQTISNPPPSGATVSGSALECTGAPIMQVWSGTTYCFGAVIVPNATYEITLCDSVSGPCDAPLVIETAKKYGDVLAPFGGISQPNFVDIDGVIASFRNLPTAPPIVRSDLVPEISDHAANFVDIEAAVKGFRQFPYPSTPPDCP